MRKHFSWAALQKRDGISALLLLSMTVCFLVRPATPAKLQLEDVAGMVGGQSFPMCNCVCDCIPMYLMYVINDPQTWSFDLPTAYTSVQYAGVSGVTIKNLVRRSLPWTTFAKKWQYVSLSCVGGSGGAIKVPLQVWGAVYAQGDLVAYYCDYNTTNQFCN